MNFLTPRSSSGTLPVASNTIFHSEVLRSHSRYRIVPEPFLRMHNCPYFTSMYSIPL